MWVTAGELSSWRVTDDATVERALRGRAWSVPDLRPLWSSSEHSNHTSYSQRSGVFGPVEFQSRSGRDMAYAHAGTSVTFRGGPGVSCSSGGGPSQFVTDTHLVHRESADRSVLQFRCAVDHVPDGVSPPAPSTLSLVRDASPRRPLALGLRREPAWLNANDQAALRRLRFAALCLFAAALIELLAVVLTLARPPERGTALRASPYRAAELPAGRGPAERPIRWHWLGAVLLVLVAVGLASTVD